MIRCIGFDADDTLWHNENLFHLTQEAFSRLLAEAHPPDKVEQALYATEMKNLKDFGYGIKGFTLSMIETAISLTNGRIAADRIARIIEMGRAMMRAPVELLEGAAAAVEALAQRFPLLLITMGDLFDQESKIARSGLSHRFHGIEILTAKNASSYKEILDRYGFAPTEFLMVGNSAKSDILPVLEIGGQAVQVHYPLCWEHQKVPDQVLADKRFHRLSSLSELIPLVDALA